MENGLSVADAMALAKDDDCGFGGNGAWVFFLFFLLAWGNNGFFGNNNRNNYSDQIDNGFLYTNLRSDIVNSAQNLDRGIRGIEHGLCDGFYAMNTTNLQGFNALENTVQCSTAAISSGITELGYKGQDQTCRIERAIDQLRFQGAQDTCAIIQAGHDDTQRIIDVITTNEIQSLRDNLQTANSTISNLYQSRDIINAIRPTPIPAYITCSPYTSYTGSPYSCAGSSGSCFSCC